MTGRWMRGQGDAWEGITATGMIATGADRARVPVAFEPLVAATVASIREAGDRVAVYLYGSVATGQARVGASDVDVLTIDLPAATATSFATALS